jgi:DNA-binding response OmpR family regulator
LLEAGRYAIVGMVGDGAGALVAARELRPDAVLLDRNLPDVDGVTIAGAGSSSSRRFTVALRSASSSSRRASPSSAQTRR